MIFYILCFCPYIRKLEQNVHLPGANPKLKLPWYIRSQGKKQIKKRCKDLKMAGECWSYSETWKIVTNTAVYLHILWFSMEIVIFWENGEEFLHGEENMKHEEC